MDSYQIIPPPSSLADYREAIAGQEQQDLGRFKEAYLEPPFDDFPVIQSIAQKFPSRKIKRQDIVNELQNNDDPYEAVILMMIWGIINSTRPQSKGDKKTTPFYKLLKADPDRIRESVNFADEMIGKEKLSLLFSEFSDKDRYKIPGVDYAYFTKIFFFIGQKRADVRLKPLILDKWTCTAFCALLLSEGQNEQVHYYFRAFNKTNGASPRSGQRRVALYESYVRNMNFWADKLRVQPDMLEQYVFGHNRKIIKTEPNIRDEFIEICAKNFD